MTPLSFEKVSFRPTFDEQEYLTALNDRYGCKSVTEFCHRFLGDCMETNVGNVNGQPTSNRYRGVGRVNRYKDGDGSYREHGRISEDSYQNSDILELVNRRQAEKIQELQALVNQQNQTITQQRMHIDQLLQTTAIPMNFNPYALPALNNSNSYDPVAMLTSEIEKAAKFKETMEKLRGW